MAEKRKRQDVSSPRGIGFLRQLLEQIRLSWALIRDDRVPLLYKFIPIVAIAYVISPLDFVPDVIPILGQLDDVGIFFTALTMFNNLAPADVVAEHIDRLRNGNKFRVSQDEDGVIIDMPPLSAIDNESAAEDSPPQIIETPRARKSKRKAPEE